MRELKGLNAILTGGSRGLGIIIAEGLAREGVNLALTARSQEELQSVAERISGLGVKAIAIAGDVTSADDRERLISETRRQLGPIDILINNAGIESVGHYVKKHPKVLEQMVLVNMLAPMQLTRALLPEMLERASGHIVTISSMAGKTGLPFNSVYAGTKAGITGWGLGLREELHGTGVSSSVISPGFITDAGMFAEYDTRAHWIAGESPSDRVSRAVVKALKQDRSELIVNPGPIKLMMMLNALSPNMMTWFFRRIGLYRFYRKLADHNEADK